MRQTHLELIPTPDGQHHASSRYRLLSRRSSARPGRTPAGSALHERGLLPCAVTVSVAQAVLALADHARKRVDAYT
jgi:hypothetical protein